MIRIRRAVNASAHLSALLTLSLPTLVAAADGAQIYDAHCKPCHGTGLDGAPMLSDRPGWSERTQKGMEALVQAAIEGVEGYAGRMPPRGGNPNLSNDEVAAAVHFMVQQALGK